MAIFRLLALALFAALYSPQSHAQKTVPEPLLVMIQTDPWLMVIGSDSPRFALYKNGDVIYRTDKGYRFVHLDEAQMGEFVASMDLAGVAKHQGSFDASNATDQPEEIFLGFDQEKPWALRVYGLIGAGDGAPTVPAEVKRLYGFLDSFDRANASEWVPEKFEVMIWPYEYAPEASIHWPEGWPSLDDPATRQRGESYSLFLPSSLYGQFQSLLETRDEKGAMVMGGKKWAVSHRFPFPAESRWMGGAD